MAGMVLFGFVGLFLLNGQSLAESVGIACTLSTTAVLRQSGLCRCCMSKKILLGFVSLVYCLVIFHGPGMLVQPYV
jgi:hypothetical protein